MPIETIQLPGGGTATYNPEVTTAAETTAWAAGSYVAPTTEQIKAKQEGKEVLSLSAGEAVEDKDKKLKELAEITQPTADQYQMTEEEMMGGAAGQAAYTARIAALRETPTEKEPETKELTPEEKAALGIAKTPEEISFTIA